MPAAAAAAAAAVAVAATRPGALMAVPIPGVAAEQPGPEGQLLVAALLAGAEPEQPAPQTAAAELVAVGAAVAAAGKSLWHHSGAGW